MINHVRTLLINRDGATNDATVPGYQTMSTRWRAKGLPPAVHRLHTLLYGLSPDWLALNYRTDELLRLIDTSDLRDIVTEYDTRITYDISQAEHWSRRLGVYVGASTGVVLDVYGTEALGDRLTGRCHVRFNFTAPSSTVLVVQNDVTQETYTLEAPYTTPLAVPGLPATKVVAFPSGGRAIVDIYARPARQLASDLKQLRDSVQSEPASLLFPPKQSERLERCRAAWSGNDQLNRSAAVLLALADFIDRTPERVGVE